MPRRRTVLAGTLAVLVAGLGGAQLLPGAAPQARAAGLVGFSGCAELLEHYRSELRRSATAYGFGYGPGGATVDLAFDSATAGAARSSAEAPAVGSGPTGTNLQEQGVDEPDLAKLGDGRLLVLTGNRLRVLSAEAQPQVLGTLRVGDRASYGGELLVMGDRALVVLPDYRPEPLPETSTDSAARSMLYIPGTATTQLVLVDLASPQPQELERATYDAQYVSARLVDGTVRVVTTTRPQPPAPAYPHGGGPLAEREALAANQLAAESVGTADVLPQVRRTAADGTVLEQGNAVTCRQTVHARSPRGVSTLMVTTMRPGSTGLQPTDRAAVTTDGDLVYASADRLYVATSRWGTVGPVPLAATAAGDVRVTPTDEVTTELHGFDTSSPDTTRYLGSGSVPGYVLGRWALSHHDGALRVATTRQPPWGDDRAGQTSSMVVKLAERDGRLVETGRVEGLGKTEHIQAVRYFGDIAAVVTFRQTDPLYLLDLSGTPRVLGELKVPGFSTYLHPLGDGLLLGLGQDADPDGRVTGVQLSVFDVSDLSRPVQVDRLHLGPGWTPAMDDSRAFAYDPARRVATIPFAGYHPESLSGEQQSALGIAVDPSGHLRRAGALDLDTELWLSRVLLDGDRLYAVGETGVVAADAATMQRTGSVDFGRHDG
jgi:uncharacterized secreted protein with C-terminal beta-propeller domain